MTSETHKIAGEMKRTKLKRKSKSELRKLTDTADRALQDYYRREYPDKKCESCGVPFELMHHFIEKSRSTYLRYANENLIFLCHRCHSLHHQFHDQSIMGRVVANRGVEWLNYILLAAKQHLSMTVKLAKEMIQKYDSH